MGGFIEGTHYPSMYRIETEGEVTMGSFRVKSPNIWEASRTSSKIFFRCSPFVPKYV